ncbi:ankyrin repeat-containing protein [Chrysochromulina tobinii]|jgi:hypothetical protein|uniref:Ankyrin repeat-containing protein n=1 Tax=Chrysochromulina tobinii TaxID=1460289 RepID=A0A0M0JIH3_9EUKA|nr:ankyrin repeat-containing protein [Chrysochromulina tobinii]|eukprot:KOO26013.1 ankyrin repeat-containing protein [Chrysochromulina sp. CCMP291]
MAPLGDAVKRGDTAKVRHLLAEGAGINQIDEHGYTALLWAINFNHLDIGTVLLEHGADVNKAGKYGDTPMSNACAYDLLWVRLVSSYGAERAFTIHGTNGTAEERATRFGNTNLSAWLVTSCKWTTPLHHLTIIPAARAHALLRKGASILAASSAPGDPTPLSLARELHAKGEAAEGSAAALVLSWWRPRLLMLAMGTHARLGTESMLLKLDGHHDLLEMIARMGS